MGNVFAASKPPKKFRSTSPPPPEKNEEVKLENPGTMEELHKKTEEIFPDMFGGLRVVLNQEFCPWFKVSHSLTLDVQNLGNYRFGAKIVGPHQNSTREVYPVLIGNFDTKGNLSTEYFDQITEKLSMRLHTHNAAVKLKADYKADKYTASIAVVNPDILNHFQNVYVGQYLHNMTPRLALGTGLAMYHNDQLLLQSELSLCARYTGSDCIASGTIGARKVHLCFYQKVGEGLNFGVEMATDLNTQKSVGTMGYFADIPENDLQVKTSFDTNGTVAMVLEHKPRPKRKNTLPALFSLSLGANLYDKEGVVWLGLGMAIGEAS